MTEKDEGIPYKVTCVYGGEDGTGERARKEEEEELKRKRKRMKERTCTAGGDGNKTFTIPILSKTLQHHRRNKR